MSNYGKILEIYETNDFSCKFKNYNDHFDGYIIETENDKIQIGISNEHQCCENWGYLSSNDNLKDFVGAELISVNVVDKGLKIYDIGRSHLNEDEAIFINLETSKGTLQLAVYNEHNGFYGHNVIIKSKSLNEETYL